LLLNGAHRLENVTMVPLPIALAWRARLRQPLAVSDTGGDDRLVVGALGLVVALAWSAGIYLMLVMQPLQREATVTRLAVSFLGSLLTLSLLPIFQPLARFSRVAPAHWPLSGRQRAVAELAYALPGFWTALGAALVGAVVLTAPPQAIGPAIVAGIAGLVSVVAWCLLLQFVLEWRLRNAAVRIVAAIAVAAAVAASTAAITSATGVVTWLLPLLAFAASAAGAPGVADGWTSAAIAVGHAAGSISVLVAAYAAGFWQWRERQSAGAGNAPHSPVQALAAVAAALRLPAGVAAAFVQHAAYLLRCPRFWFLLPYGAAFGLVFAHRFGAGWAPAAQVFAFTCWVFASSGMFLYNAFAFERRAIWQWFVLPLSSRDVLLGKNLAVAVLALPATTIGAVLTLAYLGAGVQLAAASVLLFAYFLCGHAIAGNMASIAFPIPISLRSLNQTFISASSGLVLLVTFAVVTSVAAASWWVAARSGSTAIVVAQAVLTAAAVAAYSAVLHNSTQMTALNRERLAHEVMA
jgi:hypothetical protein